MSTSPRDPRSAEVIVIGSGVAGCTAALTAAARAHVTLITAGPLVSGSTPWAQGGIAAALGADDSPELHRDDTLAAGRGLCRAEAVDVLVGDAAARIADLETWGVRFDRDSTGGLALGQEAAHSRRRIVHAGGDATGAEVERALVARVRSSGVTILENTVVLELVVDDDGGCIGVRCADQATGEVATISGGATILACGGGGGLWLTTTNPERNRGDGVAIAYGAGAEVEGMEFMQFHPTALDVDGAPHFLVSEALRGAGAHVVNGDGERFVLAIDPRGEMAPRDVVARAIWEHLAGGGRVYLDCRHVDAVATRFPTITRTVGEYGIDVTTQPVPVAPAAHYMIGGVRTDVDGLTTVPGLYACGEVASSGVHGANRLASNSLLEGIVFGRRAADAALRQRGEMPPPVARPERSRAGMGNGDGTSAALETLRAAMWHGAGISRDAVGLQEARKIATEVADQADMTLRGRELRAAATTASLVLDAALLREESRGAHQRRDFPAPSDTWHGLAVMHKEKGTRFDRHAQPHD